jgi:hypothetical protein
LLLLMLLLLLSKLLPGSKIMIKSKMGLAPCLIQWQCSAAFHASH